MLTEYEATFRNVNKDEMRAKLKTVGATLKKPEFLQKRVVFNMPSGHEVEGGWVRVRDEHDKITMSLKIVKNGAIEDQKEVEIKIDDFENGVELLELLGCERKAYQETRRERWELDGVEITIDEWPYLEPFVEIEGESEAAVRAVGETLGFDYANAYFGSVDGLYAEKYGIAEDKINNHTPLISFDMPKNPFQID